MCLYTVTRDLWTQEAHACIFCVFPKRPIIDNNIEYVFFYNKIPLFLYEIQKNKTVDFFRVRVPPSRNKTFNNKDHTFFRTIYQGILPSAVSVGYCTHLLDKQMNAVFLI